jgi:asparagine synthase (glutamine-hydrolysing)
MCGITGFWEAPDRDQPTQQNILTQMSDQLYHRGPDAGGTWSDPETGIGLGHRRLSIVDLSPGGHQPMHSKGDRYALVFNGEIYNYEDLRQQLNVLGHGPWRGHSDTEVMLAAFSEWGVEGALKKFNGMFAFALWDKQTRQLYLSRDRLGEKPLYYGWCGNTLLFGSELKALKAHPAFNASVNRDCVALFLRFNYIPAPHSIYAGIYKLPAGSVVCLQSPQHQAQPEPYWSFKAVAEQGINQPWSGTDAEAIAEVSALLQDAVDLRMVADVPVGAFLSGGIDSSLVVALMQQSSKRPVKTFAIGFEEASYNEAHYAKTIAQHLGTDHTELYVTPQDAINCLPNMAQLYDEPFADSSQIPTFLVSQLARQQVTVSLSGDGGDEVFGGYRHYLDSNRIWNRIAPIPRSLRQTSARMLNHFTAEQWNRSLAPVTGLLPSGLTYPTPGERLHFIADMVGVADAPELYLKMMSHFKRPESIVANSREPQHLFQDRKRWPEGADFTQHMLYMDSMTYLPDDILVKVDRAGMGVSLEGRIPLLDHRVVELAWQLPMDYKIRNGETKWILRQILDRHIPRALFDRPKKGFAIPIEDWLKGPLKEWAGDLLNADRLKREGFFDADRISQCWADHISDRQDFTASLWNILMFQAWLALNPS